MRDYKSGAVGAVDLQSAEISGLLGSLIYGSDSSSSRECVKTEGIRRVLTK